jgi:hypothetical protein
MISLEVRIMLLEFVVTLLEYVVCAIAFIAAASIVTALICVPVLLATEGVLGEVLRDWFGPPRPQIRVIGPGGPDDVLFEGEEVGVKSTLRQIPYAEKRGWRIEKMEPLPPKILNILR